MDHCQYLVAEMLEGSGPGMCLVRADSEDGLWSCVLFPRLTTLKANLPPHPFMSGTKGREIDTHTELALVAQPKLSQRLCLFMPGALGP